MIHQLISCIIIFVGIIFLHKMITVFKLSDMFQTNIEFIWLTTLFFIFLLPSYVVILMMASLCVACFLWYAKNNWQQLGVYFGCLAILIWHVPYIV